MGDTLQEVCKRAIVWTEECAEEIFEHKCIENCVYSQVKYLPVHSLSTRIQIIMSVSTCVQMVHVRKWKKRLNPNAMKNRHCQEIAASCFFEIVQLYS
ncbi:Protein of unknown function [Gryllus bimaculatus]|nr:Protein of unknown function [Gryllus bimaculatus]